MQIPHNQWAEGIERLSLVLSLLRRKLVKHATNKPDLTWSRGGICCASSAWQITNGHIQASSAVELRKDQLEEELRFQGT